MAKIPQKLVEVGDAVLLPDGRRIFAQGTVPAANMKGDRWIESGSDVEWFWNGSYWLSTQLFQYIVSWDDVSIGDIAIPRDYPAEISASVQYDLFLLDFSGLIFFTDADTNSNYWDLQLRREDASGSASVIATLSGQGAASGNNVLKKTALDTHLDLSSIDVKKLVFVSIKTGSPSNLFAGAVVTYRWAHL